MRRLEHDAMSIFDAWSRRLRAAQLGEWLTGPEKHPFRRGYTHDLLGGRQQGPQEDEDEDQDGGTSSSSSSTKTKTKITPRVLPRGWAVFSRLNLDANLDSSPEENQNQDQNQNQNQDQNQNQNQNQDQVELIDRSSTSSGTSSGTSSSSSSSSSSTRRGWERDLVREVQHMYTGAQAAQEAWAAEAKESAQKLLRTHRIQEEDMAHPGVRVAGPCDRRLYAVQPENRVLWWQYDFARSESVV